MNKNLNLVNILKDCPKGTKLYSIIHGEIELEEIIFNDHYPIKYKFIDRDGIYGMDRTTADGRHFSPSNGECTLFPSKDQRDWSKFNIEPKFDISTLQHFDKVLVRDNNSVWRCDFYNSYVESMEFPFKTVRSLYKQCIPYNEDTKHLVDKNEKPPKKYITWEE